METTHDLLDLICLYCDKDPVQDGGPQTEDNVSHPWAKPVEKFEPDSFVVFIFKIMTQNDESIIKITSDDPPVNG